MSLRWKPLHRRLSGIGSLCSWGPGWAFCSHSCCYPSRIALLSDGGVVDDFDNDFQEKAEVSASSGLRPTLSDLQYLLNFSLPSLGPPLLGMASPFKAWCTDHRIPAASYENRIYGLGSSTSINVRAS